MVPARLVSTRVIGVSLVERVPSPRTEVVRQSLNGAFTFAPDLGT